MTPTFALAFLVLPAGASAASPVCAFENIFGAGPPPYYVAYHLDSAAGTAPGLQANKHLQGIKIDGSLDDPAWLEVGFTAPNPDICGTPATCPPDNATTTNPTNDCGVAAKPSRCDTPRCAPPWHDRAPAPPPYPQPFI
jgi:hypothetical protein